ncbi:MAG: hypothetical protein RR705_07440 [Lachnospiraceae bacterium]
MSNIKFRLAKPSDAKHIAYVHLHIRDKYDKGFFAQVNYSFLKQYYKVMLNDPYEVVVCAEDETGKIVGFSSGSLHAEKQFRTMRDHKYSFVCSLMTSAFSNPRIIKSAFDRFKSTKGESENKYVISKGARAEYWGWLTGRTDTDQSVIMQEIWLYFMKLLGAKQIFFEVDKVNKRIYKYHKINGAEELSNFIMPDGRERVEFVYNMDSYSFKI